jgi:hypothetical protein
MLVASLDPRKVLGTVDSRVVSMAYVKDLPKAANSTMAGGR